VLEGKGLKTSKEENGVTEKRKKKNNFVITLNLKGTVKA
jgi:hypothetical protein